MNQLYFIRHGNADYFKGNLTPEGRCQVERLSSNLESMIPEEIQGVLVSSPSDRTLETAKLLRPMIEKKVRGRIEINMELLLSEIRSLGNDEFVLANGRENVCLIEKYNRWAYGFFVGHERIIAATGIAILEKYKINLPPFLQFVEDQPDEEIIQLCIEYNNCSRGEALTKIKESNLLHFLEFPRISEASAIHLDLLKKQVRYIIPK